MSNLETFGIRELYDREMGPFFTPPEIPLGPWTSHSLLHDPKHLSFVLSRYKFCAKMLHGKARVMEVGVGDAFGLPIVAQSVGHVYAVDWDARQLEGNARRLAHLKNVSYVHADLNRDEPALTVDAIYWVDVLEHLKPDEEDAFIQRLTRCLTPEGVLLTGTPNVTSAAYASPQSQVLHINLKSMEGLRGLMAKYFHNVFMFGMNDEVLHTGYGGMCHYIWSLAVGIRK